MDYRDFEKGEKGGVGTAGFWWHQDDDKKTAAAVVTAAKFIDDQQSYRTADNLRHARLYGNFDALGFGGRDFVRSSSVNPNVNRISLNVVTACVDTLAAKIAKNRPRPSFQTFGGDWGKRQRAKKLEKFCQGKFYEMKLYQIGARCFIDECVFGTGIKKFFERDGRVCCERVLPDEIKVDDADGIHGAPRQMFHVKTISREVLMGAFAEPANAKERPIADAIRDAKRPDDTGAAARGFGDMVEVYEAWHLPSSPTAGDGLRIIAVDGAVLEREEWKKDYFPFTFQRFSDRLVGFWGQGLAERLTGIQLEINRLLKEITESLRLVSKPRVFLQGTSNVPKSHINNEIGTIITYNGKEPIFSAANVVPPEQFAQLDRLFSRAFEEAGISQLSATQQKPAGLDSGAALREYGDNQSERFSLVSQGHDQSYMDDARIIIDMTRDIYRRTKKYEVRVPGRKFLESIDWKDVDLAADEYVQQIFPVSSLPTTPAARTATVQEWIQAGFVDQTEGRRLLDFPDLEQSTNLAVAAIDDVDATIDAILYEGVYMPPEEFQDLDLLLQRSTAAYLKARHENCPEKNLALLQDLMTTTAEMLKARAAPAPAADAAAQMAQGPSGPPVGPDAGMAPPMSPPQPVLQ